MSAPVMRAPQRHRHTVSDYYRMAEAGILPGDLKVELIEGEIIDMAPIGSRHASAVKQLARLFQTAVGNRAIVSVQDPVRLGDLSEPQPDLALLRWRDDFYAGAHPAAGDVLLIVEVADTSLEYDRDTKLPLYARHGIPEAWLIDLSGRRIERFSGSTANGFTERAVLHDHAAPLALPDCPIKLHNLV